jgi:nitrite reductase (cytochrome c-552)
MSTSPSSQPPAWRGWAALIVTAVVAGGVSLLLASILERRNEAATANKPLHPIATWTSDSAAWAVNYPRQYASYKQMEDSSTQTTYGGATKRDLLEETPANVVLFAGYPFAKDYKQARGHVHAVQDVKDSGRYSAEKTPATCWTCKSPDVPRLMEDRGIAAFYSATAEGLKPEIQHAIGCADCHDSKTMALTITRPALREALERQGKKVDDLTHQDMRSMVCAQCHVEYYFANKPSEGKKNYLTFPWDDGLRIEDMEAYYDRVGHVDFVHAISKTPIVKMQHPDYEVFQQGIHAARNVACADCHMPYRTEGGQKFSDHHIQSPLLNVANSCGVCHRWGESEIKDRVTSIQHKIAEGRHTAEAALSKAHFDIAACIQAGANDEELKPLRDKVRLSQMYWDYVAANNGMGFHAPQECQRVLAKSADLAQEARVLAVRLLAIKGRTEAVNYPDFGSRAKAQAVIKSFIDGTPPKL